MKKNLTGTLLFSLFLLAACSKESPELIPCMCDGSESTLGMFDCMCEPVKKKPVRRISYLQDDQRIKYQSLIINDEQQDAYVYLHKSRNSYAPIRLSYVDFRIKKNRDYEDFDQKLGNYRFRIFGCRRETKNAFLNEGRTMQKDMHFFDVFYETMNDYYPVVVDKNNMYYLDSDRAQEEYVLTAEINDYFMNICDEFDWDNVKQQKLRSGSSEMTVTWRIMNLRRDEVYCKGTTNGYGQVADGEPNGENLLVERSFEDALTKLPEVECFNSALALRIRPEDIAAQLAYMQGLERDKQTFVSQYGTELKGIELMQECASGVNTLDATNVTLAQNCGGVEMSGGVETSGNVEMSGGTTDRTIVKAVKDNVKLTDDYWVDVPLNSSDKASVDSRNQAESSFANSFSKFCIQNQPPYETLNPQKLYKVRASIVAVENAIGKKGAGLIIADNLVLTSADLMVKDNNGFKLQTINGKKMQANAFRVNPNKNVALLVLNEPTQYTPLPLSLELPEVNKDILMTLGMLNLDDDGENYIDNEGKVVGYRWSEEKGAEIVVDTFVQSVTLGGALIDKHGNIVGLAHTSKRTDNSQDLFIPIETGLKGLGLEICGRPFSDSKPKGLKTSTALADAIDKSDTKTPDQMSATDKK